VKQDAKGHPLQRVAWRGEGKAEERVPAGRDPAAEKKADDFSGGTENSNRNRRTKRRRIKKKSGKNRRNEGIENPRILPGVQNARAKKKLGRLSKQKKDSSSYRRRKRKKPEGGDEKDSRES